LSDVTPRVLFSRCLGFDNCRYNGVTITDRVTELLKPYVEPVTVCPEVAIGLGVPRPPIRLVEQKDVVTLYQPETDRDVTREMQEFCAEYLSALDPIDAILLKYRPPSCGPNDVKIYNSRDPKAGHRKGQGMFAQAVLDAFPDLPLEDEGRLQNFDIRSHFLTKLFSVARLREAQNVGTMGALVQYHASHKLLLMAYNQVALRVMGRLVANEKRAQPEEIFPMYRAELLRALARAPRRTSAINVLQHAFGYVSEQLSKREREHFLETLDRYRASRIPLTAATTLLRSWILRFDVEYLAGQTYFEPYPLGLVEVLDSGKGRAL